MSEDDAYFFISTFGILIVCLLFLVCCGCATAIVRVHPDNSWSFYGVEFCQKLDVPVLDVKSNGMFTIKRLTCMPDKETASAVTAAAVEAAKK